MDSIESLRLKVSQLEEDLEDTQENLYKAAECGNTLLGTNQLLNDKLEAREKEYAARLEVSWSIWHGHRDGRVGEDA